MTILSQCLQMLIACTFQAQLWTIQDYHTAKKRSSIHQNNTLRLKTLRHSCLSQSKNQTQQESSSNVRRLSRQIETRILN